MKNIQTLDQIKNKYYGEIGTPERDRLEKEHEALRIRFKSNLTKGLTKKESIYQK